MLLRNRPPQIETAPAPASGGFEHLPQSAIAVVRWLAANRVDYVLVGPIARSIRGDGSAHGPVAIVPAPYGRNLDRLVRALVSAHARPRVPAPLDGPTIGSGGQPFRLSADKLLAGQRWTLRCGAHDLDVEGYGPGASRYQEVLYEASRFELGPDLQVEVAAPEDIEHFDHIRRTGSTPEIRIVRAARDAEVS
jgi:hypothetical protein